MLDASYLAITLTNTELEALLLEQHFIKKWKPKFNIQFKDDKGYPWIKIDKKKDFPSAVTCLGKKNRNGFANWAKIPIIMKLVDLDNTLDKNFLINLSLKDLL